MDETITKVGDGRGAWDDYALDDPRRVVRDALHEGLTSYIGQPLGDKEIDEIKKRASDILKANIPLLREVEGDIPISIYPDPDNPDEVTIEIAPQYLHELLNLEQYGKDLLKDVEPSPTITTEEVYLQMAKLRRLLWASLILNALQWLMWFFIAYFYLELGL